MIKCKETDIIKKNTEWERGTHKIKDSFAML